MDSEQWDNLDRMKDEAEARREEQEAASGRSLSEPAAPSGALAVGTGSASDGIHALAIVRGLRTQIDDLQKRLGQERTERERVAGLLRLEELACMAERRACEALEAANRALNEDNTRLAEELAALSSPNTH